MKVRGATDSEWDDIVASDPTATFFHTRAWYEAWRAFAGFSLQPRILTLSSGKRVILPLANRRRLLPWRRMFFSSPAGTYGGFASEAPLTAAEMEQLADHLRTFGRIRLRLNPFSPMTAILEGANADFTQATPLEQGFEAAFASWKNGHRRNVRNAERSGVTVSRATDADDWDGYLGVYDDSLVRWGDRVSRRYPKSFFETVRQHAGSQHVLWLARHDGRVVSGALCFYHHQHAVYWHGAGSAEHFHLRAANLLHYVIMRDACDRGYLWYDFNPSGGHEGVVRFKSGFGTVRKPAGMFQSRGML